MALLRPLQITGIAEDCWCVGLRKRKLVLEHALNQNSHGILKHQKALLYRGENEPRGVSDSKNMARQASTLSYCCSDSPRNESGLWKAVRNVHYMIDKEIAAGALTLLTSVLLYPKTLGGGAVFSGCVPLSSSIMEQATPDVKRVLPAINTSAIQSQS
ncbi:LYSOPHOSPHOLIPASE-RELATED [Salix viminalis]|uniref:LYSOPHOSPHOLIPASE-RELATED n=1 Tax=Salix viminalis TaxID=40686 RepID=A0A9Q0QIN2_SALVM|nr:LYSOPHOSPHOLIPASE-RELATED [Salix viminalis]